MKTKNMKSVSTLIAVTVAFSILVAFSATVSATIHNVGPGDSIQDAIDAASPGDTIMVATGMYGGFTVPNTKANLTILGVQANVDPAGAVSRGGESVITGAVKITADNVILNGFKMTSSSYIEISDASNSALNVNVSYNILENTAWADGAVDLNGGNRCADGYIGYNTISGALGYGIQTIQNDDVTIEYNHILNSLGFAAIAAGYHSGTGIVIHGNTITNSGGKGINYWAEDGGEITDNVISNSNYEAIFTDAQATISGNQISGGEMYGILVYWGAGGSTVSGNTISNPAYEGIQSNVPVIITNNDISGGYNGIQLSNAASGSVIDGNNIHDNDYWGLSILNSVTDVTVQNNQLANNPYCGVIVWGDGEGSGIHINYNNIAGNGLYGVESKRTNSDVDAEYNWWGHASGPSGADGRTTKKGKEIGKGDAVSANVDWDPWLPQPVGHTPHDPVPPGLK
jgi:parallel beta-helix repeat protein